MKVSPAQNVGPGSGERSTGSAYDTMHDKPDPQRVSISTQRVWGISCNFAFAIYNSFTMVLHVRGALDALVLDHLDPVSIRVQHKGDVVHAAVSQTLLEIDLERLEAVTCGLEVVDGDTYRNENSAVSCCAHDQTKKTTQSKEKTDRVARWNLQIWPNP